MGRPERHDDHTPVLPILLVAVGSLSLVGGVAVPVWTLPNAPVTVVTGDVSPANPAVLVGLGLCLAGAAALVLGTFLLSCEGFG